MSAIEKREYKYMKIQKEGNKPKTSVFAILDKRNMLLGHIRWWASWRQYCFLPSQNRVFSKDCLEDICSFINELIKERKEKHKL